MSQTKEVQTLAAEPKPAQGGSPPDAALRKVVRPRPRPVLRFTPLAWAKLLFFRDFADAEVGGFGIASPENPLLVGDFVAVRQSVTSVSVSFDDDAVADFFDSQVDAGKRPEQFARIWLHTHPGESPQPSCVDEETFGRVFGRCQWAVMFVLGRTGKTYARLRFNVGPGGEVLVPVEVDYSQPFGPSDQEAWADEYRENVRAESLAWHGTSVDPFGAGQADDRTSGAEPESPWDAEDWMVALEELDPEERKAVLEELASRPDLWHEAGEVSPW